MKKIMMIADIMVAAISASAQNEVGQITLKPTVGLNIFTLTGSGNKTRAGLAAGVEAEYGVAENFGVTFGALYSMQGTKQDDSDSGVRTGIKVNLDYINIPILAQYYVIPGLAIKAGVQFGFVVRNKVKLDTAITGVGGFSEEGSVNEFLDAFKSIPEANIPADAKLNKFDFAIPVGLSYEYHNFVLDARYNIGLSKTIKSADKGKNSVFQITLGYKFAL